MENNEKMNRELSDDELKRAVGGKFVLTRDDNFFVCENCDYSTRDGYDGMVCPMCGKEMNRYYWHLVPREPSRGIFVP